MSAKKIDDITFLFLIRIFLRDIEFASVFLKSYDLEQRLRKACKVTPNYLSILVKILLVKSTVHM